MLGFLTDSLSPAPPRILLSFLNTPILRVLALSLNQAFVRYILFSNPLIVDALSAALSATTVLLLNFFPLSTPALKPDFKPIL